MGLFSRKTPEEKAAEQEEMERQIEMMKQQNKDKNRNRKEKRKAKRGAKKQPPKPRKQAPRQNRSQTQVAEEQAQEPEQVKTHTVQRHLKQMEEASKKRKNEDKASFVSRVNNRKVTLIKESQQRQELISRLSKDALKVVTDNLNDSKDLFDFYQKTIPDVAPDALVALGLITPAEKETFNYVIKNDLSNTLYQGKTRLFNKALQQAQREEFQEFADDNQELMNRLKSGKQQLEERKMKHLPIVYVLGRKEDVQLIEMFSLPTAVRPLLTKEDMEIFEQDDSSKCVLMFKKANTKLAPEFKRISKGQKFKLLLTFKRHSIQAQNEIVPFNRQALLQKLN